MEESLFRYLHLALHWLEMSHVIALAKGVWERWQYLGSEYFCTEHVWGSVFKEEWEIDIWQVFQQYEIK